MAICNLQFAILNLQFWLYVFMILGSYLVGSIPFGFLVGLARGVDVRRQGSGNIGATNVGRVLGWPFFVLVFSLDFLKGFVPVLSVWLVGRYLQASNFALWDLPVLCGLGAVLGHIFPAWLRFRGGKAGATGLGVAAVLAPWAMLIALGVWLLVVLVWRYVSLGTILASIAYVVAYLAIATLAGSPFNREHLSRTVFSAAIAALVIIRHQSNIQRLLAGTENKVRFHRKRAEL